MSEVVDEASRCNGHGVMVRRDMEVTEVVEEDAANVAWSCEGLWWMVH